MITFLPYIVGLLIFGCAFILANQYLSIKEKKKFIAERFATGKKQDSPGFVHMG